jgi:hypothetical protein
MAFLIAVNDSRHGRSATTFAQDCAKASEQDEGATWAEENAVERIFA